MNRTEPNQNMARNDDDDGTAAVAAGAAADIDDDHNRCCFDLFLFSIQMTEFSCVCQWLQCVLDSHKST